VDAAQDAYQGAGDREACRTALRSQGALLIRWQLGARGVRYTLRSQSGDPLTLDAELLQAMGFDAAARQRLAGATSVEFEGPLLLAYRAWSPGVVVGESLNLSEAASEQIERLRLQATRFVNLGALPDFPWPPPPPSSCMMLLSPPTPSERQRANRLRCERSTRSPFPGDATFGAVDARIAAALRAAEYSRWSYYAVPGGFAIVARLERTRDDARPAPAGERFLPPSEDESNNPLAFRRSFTICSSRLRAIIGRWFSC
jgi:hypothetical protein